MVDAANNPKPRNRWVPLVALVALFSCCGCLMFFFFPFAPYEGPRSFETLKADFGESLPDGSTREQAEAWFASQGFEAKHIGSGRESICAFIPNSTLNESAEIRILVLFDDNGRVRKRECYRFVYAL